MVTTVTLDTNLVQELWWERDNAALVEQILALGQSGNIELAITNRIYADIPRPPLSDRIQELPTLGVARVGSVFRLDVSGLDGGDALGSDRFLGEMGLIIDKQRAKGLKEPEWQDWDHIHGHYLAGRDVFLTFDKNLLATSCQLKSKLGIVVMSPQEFLESFSPSNL